MGADLIGAYIYIENDKKPDWDAAQKTLDALSDKDIIALLREIDEYEDNDPDYEPWLPDCIEDPRQCLGCVRSMWEQGWRSTTVLGIDKWLVLFTGEMSWGDCPNGVRIIEIFTALGLHTAAGFR